jgi:hypothetical protein
MIKNIYSGSSHITVSNTNQHIPQINNTFSGAGMIKWDSMAQGFAVSDGMAWHSIPNNVVQVDLDSNTKKIIEWANKKMHEEMELEELAKTNHAVNDLVNQIKEKQNQLEMIKSLIKKESHSDEPVAMQAI